MNREPLNAGPVSVDPLAPIDTNPTGRSGDLARLQIDCSTLLIELRAVAIDLASWVEEPKLPKRLAPQLSYRLASALHILEQTEPERIGR